MKNRGISGFGVLILIIIVLVVGYVIWQISRVHLTHGSISEKAQHAARIGYSMSDAEIIQQLITEAKDANVVLRPESIFIDRTVNDSMRIYLTYSDSSDVFGMFTYKRHFVVDKIEKIAVEF